MTPHGRRQDERERRRRRRRRPTRGAEAARSLGPASRALDGAAAGAHAGHAEPHHHGPAAAGARGLRPLRHRHAARDPLCRRVLHALQLRRSHGRRAGAAFGQVEPLRLSLRQLLRRLHPCPALRLHRHRPAGELDRRLGALARPHRRRLGLGALPHVLADRAARRCAPGTPADVQGDPPGGRDVLHRSHYLGRRPDRAAARGRGAAAALRGLARSGASAGCSSASSRRPQP